MFTIHKGWQLVCKTNAFVIDQWAKDISRYFLQEKTQMGNKLEKMLNVIDNQEIAN